MIPDKIKEELIRLKQLRREETAKLPNGSQKAFFGRVWQRLHTEDQDRDATGEESSDAVNQMNEPALQSPAIEPSISDDAVGSASVDDVAMANATAV